MGILMEGMILIIIPIKELIFLKRNVFLLQDESQEPKIMKTTKPTKKSQRRFVPYKLHMASYETNDPAPLLLSGAKLRERIVKKSEDRQKVEVEKVTEMLNGLLKENGV